VECPGQERPAIKERANKLKAKEGPRDVGLAGYGLLRGRRVAGPHDVLGSIDGTKGNGVCTGGVT